MCIDWKTNTFSIDIQISMNKLYQSVPLKPITNVEKRLEKKINDSFLKNYNVILKNVNVFSDENRKRKKEI